MIKISYFKLIDLNFFKLSNKFWNNNILNTSFANFKDIYNCKICNLNHFVYFIILKNNKLYNLFKINKLYNLKLYNLKLYNLFKQLSWSELELKGVNYRFFSDLTTLLLDLGKSHHYIVNIIKSLFIFIQTPKEKYLTLFTFKKYLGLLTTNFF